MRMDELSVRALHRLDAANSRLRHSIVEACFYNLRVLAQELPGRRGNGDFARNLAEALANVSVARRLIDEHFAYEVRRGLTVAELFPAQRAKVERALGAMESWAARGAPSREDQAACRKFADDVVKNVDDLLGAIDQVKQHILRMRLKPRALVEELVSIHRSPCEAQGVALVVEDVSDSSLEVFADRQALLNALGELVSNALRHAFTGGAVREKQIAIRLRADPDTRDAIICVCDNGRGMSPQQVMAVGMAGASTSGGGDGVALVRCVIEGDHLGVVSFRSRPGGGTEAEVRLPRRVEPPLESPAEPVSGAFGKATVVAEAHGAASISLRRKLLALLVLIIMILIGLALAWLALRWQLGPRLSSAGIPSKATPPAICALMNGWKER